MFTTLGENMKAEDRAKLFNTLATLTRDIQAIETTLQEKYRSEENICKLLGIHNSRETKRTRISQEKVVLIRTHVLSAMQELHKKGLVWLGMRVIVNVTRQKFAQATVLEIESQIRAMAKHNEIEHNGMRGAGSSYRVHTSTGLVAQ